MIKFKDIIPSGGLNSFLPNFILERIYLEDISIFNFLKKEALNIPQNTLVLDAGGGRCQYKPLFQGNHYLALDNTKGENSWTYESLDLISNLENIPFPEETFDVVLLTQVLEHVRNPLIVLKELKRILKKEGTLLLTAPQGWKEHQKPQDFFRFTSGSLEYLFSESGYSTWEIEKRGGYFRFIGAQLRDLPDVVFGG